MTVFPHPFRPKLPPYGSATLATSVRLGAGSTFTSADVDARFDRVKTFTFRGNVRGSWFIQAAQAGTERYATIAEGTFPAGQGSLTMRSFEEAVRMARARVRMSSVGSVSVGYGGVAEGRFR